MGILERIERRLGITRSDITVALFLAGAALIGFAYLTFFDASTPREQSGRELLRLAARHDSLVLELKRRQLSDIESRIDSQSRMPVDSLQEFVPPTPQEARLDAELAVMESGTPRPAARRTTKGPSGPININSAPAQKLTELPGVGPKTAEQIVEHRRHIPFRRAEDLMEVKGIGPKKFEKMKPFVVIK